ncbi:hypothetical protein DC347_01760 [Pseudarthrobacter sp. AG30]|uniref:hypothetical protein n=1 Tax=Pseudarthrobacter sp. AG30 TaxID=2249742 RepID=UPI000D64F03E|nr:hypothetical protein [Pseudarthrobacter sp. AG30]RAX18224.1 hypothetical protein DC347_01760 [Pseudarthrobacter sp. AG30]
MRPMTKKNKIAAVAMSAALVAVGGGAAYAYWSTTGGGNGSAAASSGTSPVTINVTVAPGVAPGTPQAITYTATNPNSSSTTVTLATPVVTTNKSGCLPDWFSATAPAGTTTVLAGATTALGGGTLTLNDDPATNQDACKGATITVTVGSN